MGRKPVYNDLSPLLSVILTITTARPKPPLSLHSSIYTHFTMSVGFHEASFNTLASTLPDSSLDDPIKPWITRLMKHSGGHFSILGVPAILASLSFLYRILWLKRNRVPHPYGRTALIYWPTQLSLAAGCLVLVGLLVYLSSMGDIPNTSDALHGLLAGAKCLLVACVS